MKILVIALCLLSLSYGCKKTGVKPFQSQGTLTGYDPATCQVCGGIKLTINNDTTKNAPPFYRIPETLTQMGINENTAFPIKVELDWQHQAGTNPGHYITVSRIMVMP